MQKYYIATVQIAVFGETVEQARQALSASLNTAINLDGLLLDWQYLPPLYTYPQYAGEIPAGIEIEQGEAFSKYIECKD